MNSTRVLLALMACVWLLIRVLSHLKLKRKAIITILVPKFMGSINSGMKQEEIRLLWWATELLTIKNIGE